MLEHLDSSGEPRGNTGLRWTFNTPKGAMITLFTMSIVQIPFAVWFLCACWIVFMFFDAMGISKDPVDERGVWFSGSIAGTFVTGPVFTNMITTALGVVAGAIWLKGQELEIQKQARRLSRMTTFLVAFDFPSVIICSVLSLFTQGVFIPVALWTALHLYVCKFIQKRVQSHAPPVAGERQATYLAMLLLVGSMFHIYISALISGWSSPQAPSTTWDKPSSFWMSVLPVSAFISFWNAVFGAFLGLALLVSNEEWQSKRWFQATAYYQVGNVLVLIIGGPLTFAIDATRFNKHGASISSARNFGAVVQQPLVTLLLLGTLTFVAQRLRTLRRKHGEYDEEQSGIAYRSDEYSSLLHTTVAVEEEK